MNGLDGIFILTILLLAFWGFQTGVIGAAIWLVAAYGSIVLGAQIVGWTIPRLGIPENLGSIVTSFGYILVSAAVFTLARMISMSIRFRHQRIAIKMGQRYRWSPFWAHCWGS